MKRYHIKKSALCGCVEIPASKSHTLRALLFGMMGQGKTIVRRYLQSPDSIAMIEAIKNFGAKVDIFPDRVEIQGLSGQLQAAEDVIYAGNSGQVLRFIGALAAMLPTYTVVTGDHSIRHQRLVKPLLDGLKSLGVFATSARLDGFAPILIKGPLRGGKTTLDGRDSQPVSGLLIATSFADSPTDIYVKNPGETSWIDLTLHWLNCLGLSCEHTHYTHYHVPGGMSFQGFDYTVPGDFSSLAFLLAAALITDSKLTLGNVDMLDIQGDKKIIDILIAMGAHITIDQKNKQLDVERGSRLRGTRIDINDCIDALTICAVIGCYAEGKTEIQNGAIARHKECDRIHAITRELKKMGANIQEREDDLLIYPSSLEGSTVATYGDHRMAMSLSVAALGAIGETIVRDTECVAKTYPNFVAHLRKLGAHLQEKR